MRKLINTRTYISSIFELMKEWNFPQNIGIDPTKFEVTSKEEVSWICSKGHIWRESIFNRFTGGVCPACNEHKLLPGINDLATMRPNLVREWDYEKNGELKPENFQGCSNTKVSWICDKGHKWDAVISSRFYGTKCPYCTGKKILIGFNDLETLYPNLAEEWDYKRNGTLKPKNVTANSNKKVNWICKNGHRWNTAIYARTRGNGCPFCAGHKAITGINDLKTKNPKLALQWNYELNGDLLPENIAYQSHKKVYWTCEKGHVWKSTIASRNKGNGCPVCASKLIIEGINDLQTLNPSLASEWNYTRNLDLKPTQISVSSNKKVWWKCNKGHEFKARVNDRNRRKRGCPICSNRIIIPGYNDLKTKNPKLAKEWNYKRNGLRPDKFSPHSNKTVWWRCKHGHEWRAMINDRSRGNGCPYCHGKKEWRSGLDLKLYDELKKKEKNN